MKEKLLPFLALFFLSSLQPALASKLTFNQMSPVLLALQKDPEVFDPFIDYGEFQDDVAEEESIDFFKNGRLLAVSFVGGYEALTFHMRQIYGDSPFIFGANLNFFYDLRFAFQISGIFPYEHYSSIYNSNSQFSHYGINLKYYFDRQYITEDAEFFNPYVIFGPFWIQIKADLSHIIGSGNIQIIPTAPAQAGPQGATRAPAPSTLGLEGQALDDFQAFGAKAGIGFEIPLIKQSFFGMEISYLYTNLEHESQDLSNLNLPDPNPRSHKNWLEVLKFPNRPEVEGYRFSGDLVNIVFLLGINF